MSVTSYIPAGTSIRFEVTGSADGFDDDDAQTRVRQELSKYFSVQRVYLDAPALSGVYSGWPFTAEIVVSTREAYGEINDVASIVASAVYAATSYMPAVSAPAFGGPVQNDPSVIDGSGIGDLLKNATGGIADAIGDAIKRVTQPAVDEVNTVLIVVAVVAVVLIVSLSGKTTRIGAAL